jgi:hypothetical protein
LADRKERCRLPAAQGAGDDPPLRLSQLRNGLRYIKGVRGALGKMHTPAGARVQFFPTSRFRPMDYARYE